ncbi:MAG: hypothetical protein WDO56_09560 [Gammaproteobacteria bacterium]
MDIDAFLQSVNDKATLTLPHADQVRAGAPETIDALFHLPLLALTVMIIARRSPFKTTLLGHRVGMLLVEHFNALNGAASVLEASITLRRRCADALAFLEVAGLAAVSRDRERIVSLTPAGKTHLDRSGHEVSDLGLLIRRLKTSQERLAARNGNER